MNEIINFYKGIISFISLYWALGIICYFLFQWIITPIIFPRKHNIRWLMPYRRFRFAHWYLLIDIPKILFKNVFKINFSFKSLFHKGKYYTHEEVFSHIEKLLPLPTDQKGKLFEEYIRDRIKERGYEAKTTGDLRIEKALPETIQKRGGSGEQGVDVITYIKPNNGKKTLKVLIQCKCYSNTVSNSAIQEIATALKMYDGHIAVVVSNEKFTGPSIDLANVNNVILIGEDKLVDFINDPQIIFKLTN